MTNPSPNTEIELPAELEHPKGLEFHESRELVADTIKPGSVLASALLFGLSLFLLSQLADETKYFSRVKLPLQPRFWPSLVLGFMALFSGTAFAVNFQNWRKTSPRAPLVPLAELMVWAQPVEFAMWFLLYAAAVPWIGYLAATVIVMPLLGFRVGFREPKTIMVLALIGLGAVLLFKTGLSVKMPAGAVYDLLPDGPRNFMIRNF